MNKIKLIIEVKKKLTLYTNGCIFGRVVLPKNLTICKYIIKEIISATPVIMILIYKFMDGRNFI